MLMRDQTRISGANDGMSEQGSSRKEYEEEISDLLEKIKRLEEEVKKLESQNRAQSKEIKRISSITWYQKLFGKK